MPTTANWNELFAIDGPTLLCTTPDFDPYQMSRGDESYCGVWFYRGGRIPQWNDRSGDKVIAYLKSTVDLPLICERLGSLGANLLLVCDGVIKQIDAIRCMEHVCLSGGLIDLDQCGDSCALVICNGNHGITLKALSLGIPVAALPLFIEQRLNAVALEQTGWGVSLPSYSTQWQAALGNLINDSDLKSRLAVYSEKLRQFNAGALDRSLAGVLAWISGTAAE